MFWYGFPEKPSQRRDYFKLPAKIKSDHVTVPSTIPLLTKHVPKYWTTLITPSRRPCSFLFVLNTVYFPRNRASAQA